MWIPKALRRDRPLYLALADRLAEDIATGRLRAGARLPAQRPLAKRLGIDFTTVSRAYAEAQRRGLIAAQVGRGTFVRAPGALGEQGRQLPPGASDATMIDLSLNLPPDEVIAAAARAMAVTVNDLVADGSVTSLLRYQQNAGREDHRVAAAAWVADRYGAPVDAGRVILCGGAQHAMAAVLASMAVAGDIVATEALTYPGMKALADVLGLHLRGVALDNEGIDPDALRALCRREPVRFLYCTPALQNPTVACASESRRRALAAVAHEFGLTVLEDDVYGPLVGDAQESLCALGADGDAGAGHFIASLSKIIAPGLRIAVVVAPTIRSAERVASGVRATAWMASPLSADISARWLRDGTARKIITAGRREAEHRQRIATSALGAAGLTVRSHPRALHLWMELPPGWSSAEFVARTREAGVAVAPAESFHVGAGAAPAAVRLSLGAASSAQTLELALERLIGVATRDRGAQNAAF